jgi:Flp pilus assembly protein TadD
MKKERAIVCVLVALVVGFIAGSVTAILKGTKEPGMDLLFPVSAFSLSTIPPSIELTEAIENLKETLRRNPRDLPALIKIGELYSSSGKTREAIAAYSEYLTVRPEDPDVRTHLGILLRRSGDTEGAVEEFRKAARGAPRHANSQYNLGIVLLYDRMDTPGAIQAWEDFLKVAPEGEMARRVRDKIGKLRGGSP